jgi:hypothetical protein
MANTFNCPKCNSIATLSGKVNCLCDKDNCLGQRCGADELSRSYQCTNPECSDTGIPEETKTYRNIHLNK